MNEISTINTILKAYELISDYTPLKSDCGKICDCKCCKGDSNDGMLLFPGEEALFKEKEGFTVYFEERYNCYAVRCEGNCERNERPLACRIFPYFIYSDASSETNKTTVAPDIRAEDFCPLLYDGYKADKKFLRALRMTALLFSTNPEIMMYLRKITAIMTDFNNL